MSRPKRVTHSNLSIITEERSDRVFDSFNSALIAGNFDAALALINSGEIEPFLDPESQAFACLAITKYCDDGSNKEKIKDLAIDPEVLELAKKCNFFECKITSLPILKFFGSGSFLKHDLRESSREIVSCVKRCESDYSTISRNLLLVHSGNKDNFYRVFKSLPRDNLSASIEEASIKRLADRSVEEDRKGCCVIS